MADSYDSPKPSPHDEKPIDWPSDEWEAFGFLHEGATIQEVANHFRLTRGEISRWVRKWRDRYGPDVYVAKRGPRTANTAQRVSSAMGKGRPELVAGAIYPATPYERAIAMDRASASAAEVVEKATQRFVQSPILIAGLEPKDLLDLARAACLLSARAQGIMQGPGAGSALPGDTASENDIGVDISALEAGPSDDDLLQAADDVIRQFKLFKGGKDEAVETDGREVS